MEVEEEEGKEDEKKEAKCRVLKKHSGTKKTSRPCHVL